MKNNSGDSNREKLPEDLASEYKLDYSQARPNRFAGREKADPVVVVLAPDVAAVFNDTEAVNAALRALLRSSVQEGDAPS